MEDFDNDKMFEKYHAYVFKKLIFIAICIVGVILTIGLASTYGSSGISISEVYRDIWYHMVDRSKCDDVVDWIVFEVRLPRIMAGMVSGAALAVAGAAMQSMMKNPLADPYTTGISSGASFGATLFLGLGFSITGLGGGTGLILTAFVFSLIPAAVIVLVSSMKATNAATMILAGIAVMYLFNALTTLIKLGLSEQSLSAVYNWSIGDLSGVTWDNLKYMAISTLGGMLVLMAMSKKLNILITGDKNATALGLNAHQLRIVLLIVISLMAATICCFTGVIGFVGMVAPQIVRIFLGSDNRYLVPASAAFGAVLLMAADLVSRVIIAPTFLPVGVIMSLIGGPLFLWLLIKQRRSMW